MRIICPACGATSTVSVRDPSGVLNCIGCGKRIRYADPTPEVEQSVPSTAEVTEPGDTVDFGFETAVTSPGVSRKPATKPATKNGEWRTAVIAASVGGMATAILGVLVMVIRPSSTAQTSLPTTSPAPAVVPWDQAHRADLLRMKAQAESLAMQSRWQQSYDAYQQILTFVGDHPLTDPIAVAVIQSVQPGQDRAMGAITAGRALTASNAVETKPTTMPVVAVAIKPTSMPEGPATQPDTAIAKATTQGFSATAPAPVAALDPAEISADTAPPLAGPPPPPLSLHAYTLPDSVTDEQIGEAINKGVHFLSSQFVAGEVKTGLGDGQSPARNGGVPRGKVKQVPSNLDSNASNLGDIPAVNLETPITAGPNFVAPWESAFSTPGIDALCVYALLNAGRAMDVPGLGVDDPLTQLILEQLKRYDMPFTYHRSLRAAALAVFNRTQDNAALEEDVRWLLAASMNGAYTYTISPNPGAAVWDNSNSQYGLLGVWSGAQAGKAISQDYWVDVERHWNSCARGDGTWGYSRASAPTTTMTCAAVASLLVARDYIDSPNLMAGTADRPTPSHTLDAGLTWLDSGDNCMSNLAGDGMGGAGYGLYGLERVGLASGFKYFGKHDWYAELARRLVAEQHLDGSWGGIENKGKIQAQTLIDTSYALLFLARGRHPILYNKLRYDGPWNNRPHDVAHLAHFAAHELERPLNWQVVNLRRNWFDWMDCPVLYIAGDKKLNLTPQDLGSLRAFADGGGTIFTHADGGSAEFNKWVAELVRQIFPKYELMQVPRDHPMYSTVYPIKNPPPMLAVSNGSRLLLIHSPTDLAGGWQLNWTDEKKLQFQMGINLFVYAAGKGNLKNRLASTYIPADPDRPDTIQKIAVLQYPGGEWNPEPYAWTRFSRYFPWETHQAVLPVVAEMKSLTPGFAPMAVLTGTVRHDFTEAECAAVQAYVQAGGVLMIDACGGQNDFVKSVQNTLLSQAFPGTTPVPIAANHPLLIHSRPGADDLTHPLLRGFANEHGGKDLPIETIAYGKGWVIFSRLDVSTGLLGTQSWGIQGFDPAYAQALMKNAVLWAEARSMPEQSSQPPPP